MTLALNLKGASLLHPGGRGVREISAQLQRGRVVAVVGPSGAGKSSLLHLAAALAAPTSGLVYVLGRDGAALKGAAYRAFRAQVGFLHQSENLTRGLPVAHNVLMGHLGRWSATRALWSRIRPRRADLAAARRALASVELEDRLWARPDELSGGEKQRVALARLAVQRPQLWLADEPTAGLDVRLRRTMLAMLLRLVREADGTALVALHDLSLLDAGFDEVWGLRAGQLEMSGSPDATGPDALATLFESSEPSGAGTPP